MSFEDELETLHDLQEDFVSAENELKQKGQEWRDKFHEAQKTIVIYEKIKRLRSGRDKSLTLEDMKVVTPASTARTESGSSSGSSGSSDSSTGSSSSSTDDDDSSDESSTGNDEDEESTESSSSDD